MSTTTLQGQIKRVDLGMGAWTLLTPEGLTYELHRLPPAYQIVDLEVKLTGTIRSDLMGTAMVGGCFSG
ncbi:MAG: hypothetical protein HC796_12155 [Synechococcaceae cyanobacterium RL_1_2]|nr:hypothetical protein [Synechococcaceae cyanobacterium RL_1_2]